MPSLRKYRKCVVEANMVTLVVVVIITDVHVHPTALHAQVTVPNELAILIDDLAAVCGSRKVANIRSDEEIAWSERGVLPGYDLDLYCSCYIWSGKKCLELRSTMRENKESKESIHAVT